MRTGIRFVAAALTAWLAAGAHLPGSAHAQDRVDPDATLTRAADRQETGRSIGLVLSGGTAKGLAHIGVIEVLEELGIPIHAISGTSMGALVGGLYAIGYDAGQLREIASDLGWTALFTDAVDRRLVTPDPFVFGSGALLSFRLQDGRLGLPSGAVRGENVLRLLERLTWRYQHVEDFRRLPIPFSAVATDLESGEAVVLDSGRLAQAMRASVSLPAVFEPVRIEGRVLVDGGYVRNLPAEDARALGADLLICSDVSGRLESAEELTNLFDVLMQTITFQTAAGVESQRHLCDVLIRPDIEGISDSDFGAVDEWIERGRAAALSKADSLRQVASIAGGPVDHPPTRTPLPDSVFVSRIEIEGANGGRAERVVARTLDLQPGSRVDAEGIDAALARLYASRFFAQVTYQVETTERDTALIVEVIPGATSEVGLGLRFDDHHHAALLLTGTIRNFVAYGSSLRLDLRLGEQFSAQAVYRHGLGVLSSFGHSFDVGFTRGIFDVYEGAERPIAEIRTNVISAGAMGETNIRHSTLIGIRIGIEHVDRRTAIAEIDTARTATYLTLGGLAYHNRFDRRSFPRSGLGFRLQADVGDHRLGGDASYALFVGDVSRVLPLGPRTSVHARATVGGAIGDDVPLHRRFHLGGAYASPVFSETQPPFWGLKPQERSGDFVQAFRLALQREVRPDIYLTAGVNVGNAFEDWTIRPADYLFGWGLALGISTLIGPVEVTVHGERFDEQPHVDLNIGLAF